MSKPFHFGMIIGRFQHMHIGHVSMIEKALAVSNKVLVMVGSSQESFTIRNPFTCKTRMDIIRTAFKQEVEEGRLFIAHIDDMTNEDDHCVEWGDYVLQRVTMWKEHFAIEEELDLFVYGNDEERQSWYRPEAIEKVSQIILSRANIPISATKMREYIVQNNLSEWMNYMPRGANDDEERAIMELFFELREELLRIPHYKEMMTNA